MNSNVDIKIKMYRNNASKDTGSSGSKDTGGDKGSSHDDDDDYDD